MKPALSMFIKIFTEKQMEQLGKVFRFPICLIKSGKAKF